MERNRFMHPKIHIMSVCVCMLVCECRVVETHFAGHSVRAELAEAERRLNPPQQSHNVKMLYPPPDDKTHSALIPQFHFEQVGPD